MALPHQGCRQSAACPPLAERLGGRRYAAKAKNKRPFREPSPRRRRCGLDRSPRSGSNNTQTSAGKLAVANTAIETRESAEEQAIERQFTRENCGGAEKEVGRLSS